jgi:Amiloride-sensitive sodium channel
VANLVETEDETTDDDTIFYLFYMYDTLNMEQRIESLDYDITNFLVAAGGNLGLFLGLCCLSVLLAFVDCLEIIIERLLKFSVGKD